MSRATITLSTANWDFIKDSLNDRLENLIETSQYVGYDFSQDIRHAEALIKVIEEYNV
jgi:hypothetical protein